MPMTNQNSVLGIAARIVETLSRTKTPFVSLETLQSWIEWDAKAAGPTGDLKLGRALNLTCDVIPQSDGAVLFALKAEHRE
jgi:hypothetical protein